MHRNAWLCSAAVVLGMAPSGIAATEFFTLSGFQLASVDGLSFTFDDLPGGDGAFGGGEYASSGLTIVNRDGLPMNLLTEEPNPFVVPFNFESAPHVLSANFKNSSPYFTEAFGDNFDFIFDPPVHFAGLFIGNIFPGGTEVRFLAVDGTVIAGEVFSATHPNVIQGPRGPADNRIFYGVGSPTPIERIRTIEPGNDVDGIVFDGVRSATPKLGDLDVDGSINGADLGILLAAWGSCPEPCGADVDGDGDVDGADLGALLTLWGT